MKNTSIIVALIVGLSLIISVLILADAIKTYGRSLEKAANSHGPNNPPIIPSSFTVRLGDAEAPLRFEVNNKP